MKNKREVFVWNIEKAYEETIIEPKELLERIKASQQRLIRNSLASLKDIKK